MNYETPEVMVLKPAINAIQGIKDVDDNDGGSLDGAAAYEDWEE